MYHRIVLWRNKILQLVNISGFSYQNSVLNPENISLSGDSNADVNTFRPAQIIEFDISVSMKEDDQGSEKTRVFIDGLFRLFEINLFNQGCR